MKGILASRASAELCTAIGRVTVNFALLEHTISSFIWGFFSHQRVGEIVTAELSFKAKVALLMSLHKHAIKDTDKNAQLEALLKSALGLEGKRNTLTHSYWGTGGEDETATRLKTTAKMSKGLQHQLEEMRVGDVEEIAAQIGELTFEIMCFMNPEYSRNQTDESRV
jgi:hypothetical protein